MATVVNTHAAKTHFSELLERALAGEEIVIARAGKPLVRLIPVAPPPTPLLGALRGQVWTAPDFDEPDEELEAEFYGAPVAPSEPDASAP